MSLEEKKYLQEPWGGLAQTLVEDCSDFRLEDTDPNTRQILEFLKELEEARHDKHRFFKLMGEKRLDMTSQNRLNSPLYDHLVLSWHTGSISPLALSVQCGYADAFNWFLPMAEIPESMKLSRSTLVKAYDRFLPVGDIPELKGLLRCAVETKDYHDEIFRQLLEYPSSDINNVSSIIIRTKNLSALKIWKNWIDDNKEHIQDDLWKCCHEGFDEGIEFLLQDEALKPQFHFVPQAFSKNVSRNVVEKLRRRSIITMTNSVSHLLYDALLVSLSKPLGPNNNMVCIAPRRTGKSLAAKAFLTDLVQRDDAKDLKILFCSCVRRGAGIALPQQIQWCTHSESLHSLPRYDIIIVDEAEFMSSESFALLRERQPTASIWMTCVERTGVVPIVINAPGCFLLEVTVQE